MFDQPLYRRPLPQGVQLEQLAEHAFRDGGYVAERSSVLDTKYAVDFLVTKCLRLYVPMPRQMLVQITCKVNDSAKFLNFAKRAKQLQPNAARVFIEVKEENRQLHFHRFPFIAGLDRILSDTDLQSESLFRLYIEGFFSRFQVIRSLADFKRNVLPSSRHRRGGGSREVSSRRRSTPTSPVVVPASSRARGSSSDGDESTRSARGAGRGRAASARSSASARAESPRSAPDGRTRGGSGRRGGRGAAGRDGAATAESSGTSRERSTGKSDVANSDSRRSGGRTQAARGSARTSSRKEPAANSAERAGASSGSESDTPREGTGARDRGRSKRSSPPRKGTPGATTARETRASRTPSKDAESTEPTESRRSRSRRGGRRSGREESPALGELTEAERRADLDWLLDGDDWPTASRPAAPSAAGHDGEAAHAGETTDASAAGEEPTEAAAPSRRVRRTGRTSAAKSRGGSPKRDGQAAGSDSFFDWEAESSETVGETSSSERGQRALDDAPSSSPSPPAAEAEDPVEITAEEVERIRAKRSAAREKDTGARGDAPKKKRAGRRTSRPSAEGAAADDGAATAEPPTAEARGIERAAAKASAAGTLRTWNSNSKRAQEFGVATDAEGVEYYCHQRSFSDRKNLQELREFVAQTSEEDEEIQVDLPIRFRKGRKRRADGRISALDVEVVKF